MWTIVELDALTTFDIFLENFDGLFLAFEEFPSVSDLFAFGTSLLKAATPSSFLTGTAIDEGSSGPSSSRVGDSASFGPEAVVSFTCVNDALIDVVTWLLFFCGVTEVGLSPVEFYGSLVVGETLVL